MNAQPWEYVLLGLVLAPLVLLLFLQVLLQLSAFLLQVSVAPLRVLHLQGLAEKVEDLAVEVGRAAQEVEEPRG